MQLQTRGTKRLTRSDAETLAVAALSFLAAEPERIGRFLAETGIGPEDIRAAANNPGFLAGILDYLIGNEAELVAFAAEQQMDPTAVVTARDLLPGASRATPDRI
ncbi:MAG: DUF3572 domain-containing protein [Bradyrhizobiaceae bacterium]|nr:DUF3572 domain-containing protein [Bradyrhizobiaceae bacterium]